MDYKNTLNLPRTEFPMKANLPTREPEILARWNSGQLYGRMLSARATPGDGKAPAAPFLLHDGPPYANGNIHIGHALNKVLKDIVRKFRHMCGASTPYRPGWDCHGLPIELEVEKKIGRRKKAEMDPVEVRRLCRQYAERFVETQREEFRRLGVVGDWEQPYLTMSFDYEAQELRELAAMMDNGALYRGRKPVHWCASCRTALAEAEVDYDDHTSTSVYVAFPLAGDLGPLAPYAGLHPAIVIWTTTPWTLPANLAIAVNPALRYALVERDGGAVVVAADLVDGLRKLLALGEVKATLAGAELEGLLARHPWIDRDIPLILGDHVTLEAGTGAVHTAPGHGHEDYVVGSRYGLDTYAPVDATGRFTSEVPEFAGQFVFDADAGIVELLRERGALLASHAYDHSYPHCWRCKSPILFRATEQWFVSMEHDGLRRNALEAIERVAWIPRWGRERIHGMVASRPDWCISRQRTWGVPIIALRCSGCGSVHSDAELVRHVAALVETEGSDVWFTRAPAELAVPGTVCRACGATKFECETDILDVWFDSGVSYAAVIEPTFGADAVSDLYLEGSDQHRGWFHTSLLTSVATRRRAPYRAVLTHGFVLDGSGRKMSKSLGNVIAPQEIIKQYGADILRLWVAAEDYRDDVKISDEILRRLADSYRRVRNTARNLLGNLYDYDPARDAVPYDDLLELDRWALGRLSDFLTRCRRAYDAYEFHIVYHALNNFCSVDLSALYFDIVKDRIYCSARDSRERRSAQTTMYAILDALARAIAPVLSFTAEEIWLAKPGESTQASVLLCDFPEPEPEWSNVALATRWERIWEIRAEVTKALEAQRKAGEIGHSLDARVVLSVSDADRVLLEGIGLQGLAYLFIVSQVELAEGAAPAGLTVEVTQAKGAKCARCWNYSTAVATHEDHPLLCDRCYAVVSEAR